MKKNNWLLYFIYVVVILCYMTFATEMLMLLDKQIAMTHIILSKMIWSTILFIVLGILLGTLRLVCEIKKEGKWRINLPKIMVLGIPSLYFSLGIFIGFSPIIFVTQTLGAPIKFFLNFMQIFQMILGYIMITSFVKVKY